MDYLGQQRVGVMVGSRARPEISLRNIFQGNSTCWYRNGYGTKSFNPTRANVPFLYTLEFLENWSFSNVFGAMKREH